MTPESIVDVFNHWKAILGHERARLDHKRSQVIRHRLQDGYSIEDLKLAIEGNAASAWHQGENDRRSVYDSICLILRDSDHVERFMEIGENARRVIEQMQKRKEQEQASHVPPSEQQIANVREMLKVVRMRR